jgi:hypothetical protein
MPKKEPTQSTNKRSAIPTPTRKKSDGARAKTPEPVDPVSRQKARDRAGEY